MNKAPLARLAGMALGLTLVGIATAQAADAPAPQGVWKIASTTPCPDEDSVNCYWDASTAGNGVGHSFYSVRVGHRVCTIYWNRKYNRSHGYCQ